MLFLLGSDGWDKQVQLRTHAQQWHTSAWLNAGCQENFHQLREILHTAAL
jgi:hypothetical protein